MSLSEIVRKVTFAGSIVAAPLFYGCATSNEKFTQPPVQEEARDDTIDTVVRYLCDNTPEKARELLENKRKEERKADKTAELKPSLHCLLALSYSAEWDNNKFDFIALSKAEKRFRSLIDRFENGPHIIEDIQDDLESYFKTGHAEMLEKVLSKFTGLLPRLYFVIGFVRLAKRDYKGAKESFIAVQKALPEETSEKQGLYNRIFSGLLAAADASYMALSNEAFKPDYIMDPDRLKKDALRKKYWDKVVGYGIVLEAFPEIKKPDAEATMDVK